MEEIEQLIYELKQGLANHLFFHFEELKKLVGETDASSYINEELKRVGKMFSMSSESLFSSLDELEKELKDDYQKTKTEGDYHTLMEIEEGLKSIRLVRSLLKERVNDTKS